MDYLKSDPENFWVFRERYDYGPFPCSYYYVDWVKNRCKKYYGAKITAGFQSHIGLYHRGRARAIVFSKQEWEKLSKSLLKKIIHEKNFVNKTNQRAKKVANQYKRFLRKLFNLENRKISLNQLIAYYKKWIWFYKEYSFWNVILWLAGADILTDYVVNFLKKYYSVSDNEIQALTTPITPSFAFYEETKLLKIALRVDFSKSKLENQPNAVRKLLYKHAQKWGFIPWEYIGPNDWQPEDFLRRIFKLAKSKKQVSELIRERAAHHKKLKEQQLRIFKKYNIDKERIRIVKDLQTIALMTDEKKEVCGLAQYILHNVIFIQIASRVSIKPIECIKFTEQELWKFLKKGNRVSRAVIFPRLKAVTSITDKDGIHVIYGNEGEKFYKKFDVQTSNPEKLNGQVASIGIAKGLARVLLNPREMRKVRRGDILVATMTTPDYLPAMKLAAAIVTDEGGITCHAAIVSREMRKPCIIGTKIATKVLKDGDLVEVDANKGIVKILRRK